MASNETVLVENAPSRCLNSYVCELQVVLFETAFSTSRASYEAINKELRQ